MADIENIQGILTKYNTTLQNCVKKITENNAINKKVVEDIEKKINSIKGRVLQARDNVEAIGKQQTDFYNTMEQEKATIRKQQEERMGKSKQEQEELQNQLRDAQNASATKIQQLEDKQKQKIQDLKEQAAKEANEAKEKQKAEDEDKLQMKMEELNKKMEEAKRVAAEKAETAKKEAEEAKKLADNEKLVQEEKLQKLEQERQAIFEQDTACEEQLEKLKANVTDMKGEIEKMTGEIETLNAKNSEDQKAAALNLETEMGKITETHKKEMEAQLNTSSEEKKLALEKAAAEQIAAIQKAVDDVKETNLLHQKQIEEATMTEKGNLEAQLEQCKQTNKAYLEEVAVHLEKYNLLKEQFESSSKLVLDDLQELVEKLGIEDIASLEKTIQDILDKKGPDETGTGGTGIDEPEESETRTPKRSGTYNFRRANSNELSEEGRAMNLSLRGQKTQQDQKKPSGNPKEAWPEEESHALAIDQDWANQNKKNLVTNMKDHSMVKKILLEGIEMYINNIGSYNQFEDLEKRIVDPRLHGMEKVIGNEYQQSMERAKTGKDDYQRQRGLYHKILNSMVSYDSNAYEYIIKEINRVGFEKVFEQLITAFHLLYSPGSMPQLYNEGVDKAENSYFKRNGKLAIKLWYGEYKGVGFEVSPVTAEELIKNAETNKDRLSGSKKRIVMKHRYYHKHDAVAKVGKTKVLAGRVAGRARGNLERSKSGDGETAQAGGFRHGKRSQKKNKRTLKSKLTAKKYSLKVGKKKKGKKGNKSKKRRKSIKIRI